MGARPSDEHRRSGDAVPRLCPRQRGRRALHPCDGRARHALAPGRADARPLCCARVAGEIPAAARRRRHLPELRDDRAGDRVERPDAAADDGEAGRALGRRLLGHPRAQVVHHRRGGGRVHHRHVPDRRRDRTDACGLLDDRRADRYAGLHHRPRHARARAAPRAQRALRGRLRRRAGAGGEPARAAGAGVRHRPDAARAGTHLPLHALAGAGAARVRPDVPAAPRAQRRAASGSPTSS